MTIFNLFLAKKIFLTVLFSLYLITKIYTKYMNICRIEENFNKNIRNTNTTNYQASEDFYI